MQQLSNLDRIEMEIRMAAAQAVTPAPRPAAPARTTKSLEKLFAFMARERHLTLAQAIGEQIDLRGTVHQVEAAKALVEDDRWTPIGGYTVLATEETVFVFESQHGQVKEMMPHGGMVSGVTWDDCRGRV